jgi:S1-C subfamily serine protease
MKRTFYQLLELEQNASPEQIAEAYAQRTRALEATHDRDARVLVRLAYQTLSDPKQRAAYDASLVNPQAYRRSEPRSDVPATGGMPKWIVLAAIAIGIGAWWFTRHKSPPEVKIPVQVIAPQLPASQPPAPAPMPAPMPVAPPRTDAALQPPAAVARSAEDVFAEVSPSIARVNVMDGSGRVVGSGSGVVIEPEVIITNCHVAARAARLTVKLGNDERPATMQLADGALDLCRLSVPGLRAPAIPLGSVSSLRTGQRVFAIGAPVGLELTISEGIVSALREVDEGTVIQTSAPISPGSSGGGLFDLSGHLVGITTFQHRYGQNLNFALPADWISRMRARAAPAQVASSTQPSRDAVPTSESAALIQGQWACHGSISGRAGDYDFGDNGQVYIRTADGKSYFAGYALYGRSVQFIHAGSLFSLAIEELTRSRMVLNLGTGQRLVCDRR